MNERKEINLNTELKNAPLFSALNGKQLDMLYHVGTVKKFPKGYTVVRQGEPGDIFYIVVSGVVKVALFNKDGKEIVLSVLKAGDFFGELSLLDNEPRSACVIVVEDSSLFMLTRNSFYNLITTQTDILKKVLKEICSRLRHADEKIESLAFLDVYGRTVRVLQQLAHDQGVKIENTIEIQHAPTHQELSNIVGTSRETISRIITLLKGNRNLVSYKGRTVVLREVSPEQSQDS
jgi:CRP/FNR family transcriptional regulator, cyclic AMP receptor protein